MVRAVAASNERTLLPVLRPIMNLREVIKQMILLEDHLFQKEKTCTDCCNKHFLTIEALLEEARTLCNCDDVDLRTVIGDTPARIRVLHHAWSNCKKEGMSACDTFPIVAELRQLRKRFMKEYASLPVDLLPTKETEEVRALEETCRKEQQRRKQRLSKASTGARRKLPSKKARRSKQ